MPGLLPDDPDARARAITWMFAALNTVEPPIVERESAVLLERDKPWYEERLPHARRAASASGWASCPTGWATPTGWTATSARAT